MNLKFTKKKSIIVISAIILIAIAIVLFKIFTAKKIITICVDEVMKDSVEDLTFYYNEVVDKDVEFEVTVLSSDNTERETMVKKLRTELMSGNGKDIYLMTDDIKNHVNESSKIPFVEDVNKTLSSGIWEDLSEYVKKDKGYKNCFEPIMKAGQLDGKQYILPITFDTEVVKIDSKYLQNFKYGMDYGKTYLLDLIESNELNNNILNTILFFPRRFIGGVIDYEKSELNITKEEISDILNYAYGTIKKNENSWLDGFNVVSMSDESYIINEDTRIYTYYPMVTLKGQPFANVRSYGAISRSCKDKDLAYSFLSMYLSDGFMNGSGIKGEKISNGENLTGGWGEISSFGGVPANKTAWEDWFTEKNSYLSTEGNNEYKSKFEDSYIKAMEQIEVCQFYNSFDRQSYKVSELFWNENEKIYTTDFPDIEERIEKAINIIYDNLKYSALE